MAAANARRRRPAPPQQLTLGELATPEMARETPSYSGAEVYAVPLRIYAWCPSTLARWALIYPVARPLAGVASVRRAAERWARLCAAIERGSPRIRTHGVVGACVMVGDHCTDSYNLPANWVRGFRRADERRMPAIDLLSTFKARSPAPRKRKRRKAR